MPFPRDPTLRGLAAVTYRNDIPNWEFDRKAVPFGTDPTAASDWHRRKGRARKGDSTLRAAEAAIAPWLGTLASVVTTKSNRTDSITASRR